MRDTSIDVSDRQQWVPAMRRSHLGGTRCSIDESSDVVAQTCRHPVGKPSGGDPQGVRVEPNEFALQNQPESVFASLCSVVIPVAPVTWRQSRCTRTPTWACPGSDGSTHRTYLAKVR